MSRYFFGAVAAVAVAVLGGSAPAPARAARHGAVTLGRLQLGLLGDINAFRARHGLDPLRLSKQLTASAAQHSREMGADGYFGHRSADGEAFWKRIDGYYASVDWGYWSVGENLLWSVPRIGPAVALRMWERSPEHLANLLAPRWREVGISAVHVIAAPGFFDRRGVTIVTADFGVRRH